MRPVSAELKFHRNARHHSEHEVDAKNARPEPRRLVVDFIIAAQPQRLQHHNQWCKSHGELWKQVVKGDREGKVQAVNQERAIHGELSFECAKKVNQRSDHRCDARHTLSQAAASSINMLLAYLTTPSSIVVAAALVFGFRNHRRNLYT